MKNDYIKSLMSLGQKSLNTLSEKELSSLFMCYPNSLSGAVAKEIRKRIDAMTPRERAEKAVKTIRKHSLDDDRAASEIVSHIRCAIRAELERCIRFARDFHSDDNREAIEKCFNTVQLVNLIADRMEAGE